MGGPICGQWRCRFWSCYEVKFSRLFKFNIGPLHVCLYLRISIVLALDWSSRARTGPVIIGRSPEPSTQMSNKEP